MGQVGVRVQFTQSRARIVEREQAGFVAVR